jgi:DNA-binding response OmpR family regulator
MFTIACDESLKMETAIAKRILIIDDEEAVVVILQCCFEDLAGWDVLTAANGYEGLAIAIAQQPDAIILDVMMPGMDGLTLLKKLKANLATKSIPVILMTAKTDLIEPNRVAALDVVGAIPKPFDPIELVDRVADFLS